MLLGPAAPRAGARCRGALVPPVLRTPFDGRNENLAKVWFEQVAYPRACRRIGADVAHVPYFAPPLFPTVPTVVTIHDLIPLILLPTARRARCGPTWRWRPARRGGRTSW